MKRFLVAVTLMGLFFSYASLAQAQTKDERGKIYHPIKMDSSVFELVFSKQKEIKMRSCARQFFDACAVGGESFNLFKVVIDGNKDNFNTACKEWKNDCDTYGGTKLKKIYDQMLSDKEIPERKSDDSVSDSGDSDTKVSEAPADDNAG